MMILIFAQWCVNNNLDPKKLYLSVYPDQTGNEYVLHMLEQTVPKVEAEMIETSTVAAVLSLFGNEELAFAVTEAEKKGGNSK
jgi:hypothetical protein